MLDHMYPQQPDPFITTQPNQGLVKFGHLNKLIDAFNTQQSQCCTYIVLAQKTLNFNTTADQIITFAVVGTKFLIKEIVVLNPSIGLNTANGGAVYTGANRTGDGSTVYTVGTLPATDNYKATINPISDSVTSIPVTISGDKLYFSLLTPQGSAATADIIIYGTKLS